MKVHRWQDVREKVCKHCPHPAHSMNACVTCDCDPWKGKPGPQRGGPAEAARLHRTLDALTQINDAYQWLLVLRTEISPEEWNDLSRQVTERVDELQAQIRKLEQ